MSWQRRALLLSVKGELKSSEKKELKFPVRTQTALLIKERHLPDFSISGETIDYSKEPN